ncbi:MAG: iron-sulfur cluster assembly scaffold protein [Deltaproteobacteria bacterium]|nr:iron-sulfur cluster assembly scaffold protein [Deltaproteobacteria bacterium]MCK5710960.1 iron-sulfur cluster assembly scaffold protein [Deltaproteobacteria bacterium]
MNQEQLMELILDHYENPRNYGSNGDADVVCEGGNPGCGDVIRVYLSVDLDGTVKDIGFSGEGCMLSQAGASLVLEIMKGKTIKEVEEMPPDIVRDILGKKLVATRPNCARLGFNTLKNAIKKWRRQEMLSSIEDLKET